MDVDGLLALPAITPEEFERIKAGLLALAAGDKVREIRPGVYEHVFTPPAMTVEDVGRLLSRLPAKDKRKE